MSRIKKQQIIDITIDLFAEHGISNVSIVMIAKTLGASKGKVYYYFKNGKGDIVAEILKIFEQRICYHTFDKNDLVSNNTDLNEILYSLFFEFPIDDSQKMHKIVRIILSEMYYDAQIAHHVVKHLIIGRENMLSDFITALIEAGKIPPLDADSIARCLNRLILVYTIEDAIRYPHDSDESELNRLTKQMIHDCMNLLQFIFSKNT